MNKEKLIKKRLTCTSCEKNIFKEIAKNNYDCYYNAVLYKLQHQC